MKKRLLAFLLSAAMACTMLSGCGSGSNGSSGGDLPEDNPEEQITFTLWTAADDYKHYTSYNDNPVIEFLNKKFNVKMDFQLPAIGSEVDNFNLMIGTGDYTDLLNANYSLDGQAVLYEDGVIIDIAPYLEEYMPNYYKILQENEELRKMVYDDEGHAFGIYYIEDLTRNQWGGLVYRRDILDLMTGGYVSFPSGNEQPTTVEDWDYMLPYIKAYFDASGLAETAPLIIPYNGFITTGELVAGFGASGGFQLSTDGTKAEFGPATDAFYNYVVKMKEWFQAGYIYQDFASRTNDLFYLPNTSLTYGGAAGVWMGLLGQTGGAMSLPDYGLYMNVIPITSPLDTEHGVTKEDASFYIFSGIASFPFCITTACDEAKIARIMTVFDYLYTDEGAKLKQYGLNTEQAADSTLYQSVAGMEKGAWWYDDEGNFCHNELMWNATGTFEPMSFTGQRLPGAAMPTPWPANREYTDDDAMQDYAGEVWVSYGRDRNWPAGATMNAEESTQFNSVYTELSDYVNTMVPKFIMGTEELTEESWAAYVEQLNKLGLEKALESYQSSLERYKAR